MKLSIITINFNNRDGLRKTIESVVNQTWQEFEYIIIDGGSTDGSVEVIKEYADRIDYWVSEPDRGIYHAMNKGIDQAKGEYCQFLNSGDTFHNNGVLLSLTHHLNNIDIIIGRIYPSNRSTASEIIPEVTMLRLFEKSLPHSSAYIASKLLKEIHYDTSYKIVSDWKFYIQSLVFRNASYKFIDITVSNFDVSGISSTNAALVMDERQSVLAELLPERIRLDYLRFTNGKGYQEDCYDRFFIHTRKYPQYAKIIYTISVLLMRIIAFFKKGALYARKFPIKYNVQKRSS